MNLVEKHQGLVRAIAHSMLIGRAELDDLIQEGHVGLVEAQNRFDSTKGVPFEKYARYWIYKEMNQYLDSFIRGPIRLPVHIKNKAKLVNQAVTELKNDGKEVTVEAVSQMTGCSKNMVNACFNHVDIRMCQVEEEYHPVVQSHEQQVEDNDWKTKFKEAVFSFLSDEERELIVLKFGLDGNNPHTYKQLGRSAKLKVNKVLNKLRIRGKDSSNIVKNLQN